jgi:acyl carrier protein
MAINDRLQRVFRDVLELGPDNDVESLKYRDIEQWDSLGHMSLVAAIEDEFNVELSTEQVIDLSSFQVGLNMLRDDFKVTDVD